METKKYLDYEGLVTLSNCLKNIINSDKLDVLGALNDLASSVGDGKLTISINNVKAIEFTANQSNSGEINISIPTSLNDFNDAVDIIKNIIKYGQSDVSNLSDEEKDTLHNQTAENSGFVSEGQLENTLANYGTIINYDSATQKVQLKNGNNVLSEFSAADFIKDSMIQDISITNGTGNNAGKKVLLIDFNTDSGITDIEIPISDIFDSDNYYTKEEISNLFRGNDNPVLRESDSLYGAFLQKLKDIYTHPSQLNEQSWRNINFDQTFFDIDSDNELDITDQVSLTNFRPYALGFVVDYAKKLYGKEIYSKQEVDNKITQSGTFDPDQYYTKTDIDNAGYLTQHQDISDKVNTYDLAAVATSGSYNDLSDKPSKLSEFTNDTNFLTQHQDISGKVDSTDLAAVATSGLYSDLTGVPTNLSDFTNDLHYLTEHQSLEGYATQEWVQNQNYLTEHQSLNLYALKSELFSGNYNDLTNKPNIPTKVSDLNNDLGFLTAHQSLSDYALKSELFSGNYNDLDNKPEIPSLSGYATENWVQQQGYLTSHQSLTDYALKSELFSGSYNDLTDLPTLFNGNYSSLSYTINSTNTNASGNLEVDLSTNIYKIIATGNISSLIFTGVPENNHSCHFIIKVNSSVDITIALSHGAHERNGSTYTLVCPNNEDLTLTGSNGSYLEFDILRIDNELFVRGI